MSEVWFEADPERMPLARLLSRAGQSLHRHYRRTVAARGLTATAMGVLEVLAPADAVSHRELAGRLGVTPATLTPVVDALASAGELTRERDLHDRRVVRISITSPGRDRLAGALGDVSSLRDGMPRPVPEHEAIIRDYLLAVLAVAEDQPV